MAGLMDGASDGAEGHDKDGTLMGDGGEDAGLETETQEEGKPETDVEEEGEHDDAKKEKLPPHVQEQVNKRIQKLDGKRKSAEERAERAETELKGLRERVDSEDSEVVLDVARNLGVLADALPKGAAKGMEQLRFAQSAVERLQETLEDATGDEVDIDGKSYSKADVRAKLKEWRATEKRLSSMYGGVEAQARKDMLEIFRLGQQAKRANWKPGSKEQPKPKDEPQKKAKETPRQGEADPNDEPVSRVRGGQDGEREPGKARSKPYSLV
jgi:prefoldin subunit 5